MNDAEVRLQVKLDDSTAEKSISSLSKKTDELQKKFSNAGKTLTIGLTTPIVGFVAAGAKYNADMEQYQAGLETMLGSAEKAEKVLGDLKAMANKTPFETTDLIKSNQTMLAFGLSADESAEALQMLGDVSMGNAEKLSGLTLAYSQVQSTGRLMGQDLLQMINQGFNPLQIISQKTGKSMAELKKDMENGAISADMVTEAFKIATSEGGLFFGAMEKQSQTTSGKLSTLKDAFAQASGTLTETLLPVLTTVVSKLTEFFNWLNSLDESQKNMILTILGVIAALGPLLLIISGAIGMFQKLGVVIGFLTSPIGLVVLAVAAIGVAIYQLIKNWDTVTAVIKNGLNFWKNIFKSVANFIAGIFRGIVNGARGMVNSLISFLNTMIRSFLAPFNLVIKGLNKLPGVNIKLLKFSIPKMPMLEVGTNMVQKDGLAYLHEGEAVVPKKYNPALGGGYGGTMTLYIEQPNIELDGNKVGKATTPYITKTVKLGGGNV